MSSNELVFPKVFFCDSLSLAVFIAMLSFSTWSMMMTSPMTPLPSFSPSRWFCCTWSYLPLPVNAAVDPTFIRLSSPCLCGSRSCFYHAFFSLLPQLILSSSSLVFTIQDLDVILFNGTHCLILSSPLFFLSTWSPPIPLHSSPFFSCAHSRIKISFGSVLLSA